jgi:hypothetical protein
MLCEAFRSPGSDMRVGISLHSVAESMHFSSVVW